MHADGLGQQMLGQPHQTREVSGAAAGCNDSAGGKRGEARGPSLPLVWLSGLSPGPAPPSCLSPPVLPPASPPCLDVCFHTAAATVPHIMEQCIFCLDHHCRTSAAARVWSTRFITMTQSKAPLQASPTRVLVRHTEAQPCVHVPPKKW